MLDAELAWRVLNEAEVICDEQTVSSAVHRLAGQITEKVGGKVPVVLSVMGGGVVFAGQLLPLLRFPLEFDYVHATRYRGDTRGGRIDWVVRPRISVSGRTVLIIDDILDEGRTLAEIRRWLLQEGATNVYTAVLADKEIGKEKPLHADFVGVTVPNRYVFGFGMDVRDAWRNLPAIYALKE